MNVGYDLGLDRIFVVWPITICHVIDENSPLYEYSAENLSTSHFEIVAILEGVVPSTGSTTQARTSYLPCEILWGHRFEKLVTYQRDNGTYKIDFSKFDNVYPVDTPTLSAKEVAVLAIFWYSLTLAPVSLFRLVSLWCPPHFGALYVLINKRCNNENESADQNRESTPPPTARSYQYVPYSDAAPNGGDAAPMSPTSLKIVYDDARRQSIFDILNRHRLQSFDYAPLPLPRRRSSSNFEGSCNETDADPTVPKGHSPLNRGVSDTQGQTNANQNNSLKSLANTNASAISLTICKEKQSSLMREHDIM
uniref:Inward rectifier potassium channel C-terminal domain-containing protein n=1 Tax=Romanomermis culicivorax TaxID=13658 RepID=A0A915K680_ROMCU